MNKALKPFWAIVLIAVGVMAFSFVNTSGGKERIPWRTDIRAASEEAQKSNKPLFLYFTAKWCGPCQSLKSTTWADENVEKALSGYVPVKIDIDEHPEIAKHYPAEGIPHFVIAKSDGTMVRDQVGAMQPGDFVAWLSGKAM